MARIRGIELPNKRGDISLTYIYGIGKSSARKILEKAGVDFSLKVDKWTDEQLVAIRNIINEEYKTEGELRSEVQMNIKRLIDIGCYRGIRHRKGLPVRGQRTHTNARTRKGKKKGAIANKKQVGKK
ncbi:MAG TPA: 30S ribosomal protein S13 [Bacteroidia bacterium]|nr:30S ribosomal protein S13 [Sphingobacteriales bacterium]HPD65671.1 30S ribosomal protein S13 [Bacteroidia bacterium]HRS58985.1 30S ribosomal protein S13 [Bacteroidia bacterium]HRU67526.1 30S ribosomal protein S13 [Bacteroidia bacterium]